MTQTNLRSKAMKGASFTVAGRLIRALQGIGVLAVLSRYLSPAEFGVIAMTGFVTGIAQIFIDFGTRVALVQRRDVTKLEENCVFWWNLGIGVALSVGLYVLAPWIAQLMDEPRVLWPLRMLSPIFIFGALQGVPQSVLERGLAFGWLTAAEVSAALGGSLAAILLAVLGYKLEALVAQMMVAPVMSLIVTVIGARWRPDLQFSFAALRPLLSYGSYVTAAGVVQFLGTQMDRPIVGNRLSSADLGYAQIAEQIVLSPLRITVQMVRKVMFPIMSSIQNDDARMRRGYLTTQHALMVVMAPIAFGLWAVAAPVVRIVLGPGWEMVAVLMGFVTVRSVFNTFNDINGVVLSAKGEARLQFHWAIVSAALNVAMLLAMVRYGIVAVVAGRLAMSILLTPVYSHFALRRIGQPMGEVVSVLSRPLLAAVAMAGVVWQVQQRVAHEPAVLQLLICIPLGMLLYALGLLLLDRSRILGLLRTVRARRAPAGA